MRNRVGQRAMRQTVSHKGRSLFANLLTPPLFFLRLRPVLRVFGSFCRAVDATHAAGRVLRSGRLRRRQETEHRVSRRSERAQQAVEVCRGRRRGGTETGESRGRMGSTGHTGEWRAFHEWHGKLGGGCRGYVDRRPDGLRSVLSLFFLCDAQWTFISVDGKPMPFSQVGEEHHDLMTADEYAAYFEIFQQRSG
jgi:hypothetical protein